MTVEPVAEPGDSTITINVAFGSLTLTFVPDEKHPHNMADVIESLVRPALLAAGFGAKTVDEYVPPVY